MNRALNTAEQRQPEWVEEEDPAVHKYLAFPLDDREFAIPIARVMEIMGVQKITSVPEVPAFIRGVINLRGKIIPVMDVRARFRLETRPYSDRTCIIVVTIEDAVVGLIVDGVSEVLDIPAEQVSPAPDIMSLLDNRFIMGLGQAGDGVKILLDMDRLLSAEEVSQLPDED